MTKDRTITFRASAEQVEQLKQINFSLFEPTISDTLRKMISREYHELSKAGLIK